MKAVLVIDMPSDCNHCQFADFSIAHGQWECNQRGESIYESMKTSETPTWCPLKPLPEHKKPQDPDETWEEMHVRMGYNKCLEEIEK